jgi:hypothetical protein
MTKKLLLITVTLVTIMTVNCVYGNQGTISTGDLESPEFINPFPDKIYSEEDFDHPSVKFNKKYDVAELPSAISATRIIFDKKYVEVRLYETSDTANEEGKTYAKSVTGPDGVVSGDSVMWQEKERDRRKCVPKAGRSEAGCDQVARYGGFLISGNLVLLCEGLDMAEADSLCRKLIEQLNE